MILITTRQWLLTGKEVDRILWGNGNTLYLDLGGGYIGDIYICKNFSGFTSKICAFYCIYILYQ